MFGKSTEVDFTMIIKRTSSQTFAQRRKAFYSSLNVHSFFHCQTDASTNRGIFCRSFGPTKSRKKKDTPSRILFNKAECLIVEISIKFMTFPPEDKSLASPLDLQMVEWGILEGTAILDLAVLKAKHICTRHLRQPWTLQASVHLVNGCSHVTQMLGKRNSGHDCLRA